MTHVPPPHSPDVTVRTRARAPPVAAAPVTVVVPAARVIGRRPVGHLVPAEAGCGERLVGHQVPIGEDVVVGGGHLAAPGPSSHARAGAAGAGPPSPTSA